MNLTEQVLAQACLLAGVLEPREQELLRLLCSGAVSSLKSRLRPGLTPEDCRADFVAAASLFALSALSAASEEKNLDEMKIGDVTLKRSCADTASKCLHSQGELIIAPYLADRFCFRGV
jgi:hypothetical protein